MADLGFAEWWTDASIPMGTESSIHKAGWFYRDAPGSRVPEPGTILLVALGLFGIAARRKRAEVQ